MQRVDISSVVMRIAQTERNQAKSLEIVIDIDSELPQIQADHDRLGLLVHNLVDNAFNYTPVGGKINVTAHLDANNQYILVTISDTGVGIPDDFRERAWLRFERYAEHALQFDIAGTGLGLPIVKELVELHNGQVWFDSKVGEGTSFYVRLPVSQSSF